jgi:hypothetical protein
MTIRPWRFRGVIVVSVHVGRVPRVFGVVHRRLSSAAVPPRRGGLGRLGRCRRSLGYLGAEFLEVR